MLQNSIEGILICFTLLISGVASRVAIGFSPSIFVSGNRTCAVMGYCIIAIAICTVLGGTGKEKHNKGKSLLVCDKTEVIYSALIVLESKKFYQKNNSSIWIYGIFKLSHLRKIQTPRKELFHV